MQKIIMKKNKLHNALDLLSTMMQVVIVKCAVGCPKKTKNIFFVSQLNPLIFIA